MTRDCGARNAETEPVLTSAELVALLERSVRGVGTEDQVQRAIQDVFERERIRYAREVRLNRTDRIDFMVEPMIGVEVKIGGSLSAVIRQLYRYAQVDAISELVLVTSKGRLAGVPDEMNGKRIVTAALRGGFF